MNYYNEIKQELVTSFTKRIEVLNAKAQNILRVRGENADKSSAYQQLQAEITKCTNALESFDQIMEYDDELLIKLLSSFYQIDYYYYDWYTKMELRSLKESDELYKEHTATTGKAVKTASDLYEGQTSLRENNDKLQKLNNELISFLESIIDFDIEEFEDKLIRDTLNDVYMALEERGYNPTNQIVGYLISGDPGYISSYKDARTKIQEIDRAKIVEILLSEFQKNNQ